MKKVLLPQDQSTYVIRLEAALQKSVSRLNTGWIVLLGVVDRRSRNILRPQLEPMSQRNFQRIGNKMSL